MAVTEIERIRAELKSGQRLLGLDIGSKTIGLALSDVSAMLASPAETIRRTKFTKDVVRLKEIIAEEDVGGLVLGLPVSMDGTEGPRCQSTRDFATNLLQHIDLPIAFWDERLSTAAVQRVLIKEADMTRKRQGEVVDKMAAAYILQGALDAMKGMAAG
ncbi:MAG: Holliday junction resolvase RuvX [Alphaproteobacteria bacterium]|nr:Holliday junction resolvase RuvX [Alphaproteobacteria bacterium]MBT7943905.1 Holliday junction resolvase RuvX [Alphaproteobacteria bacterium]